MYIRPSVKLFLGTKVFL